ncbi:helix-turn-helix domain-containing protein [uncultured Kordia sp.]|uniref:helix-turn-helix domain-containing protein n=1 Tax=uncultured Kordia sp. TaxID=507699 RepID=UPI00260B7903|nr:helix-turn-helix domain-containing protein [uncultured Kordia sp.]
MELKQQAIFLFSALGGINGLFLSFYFAFVSKKTVKANYFLSALLFVLSVRIIKSVFFYFNPNLSQIFIQIGLSACVLIGPFLYLYIKTIRKENKGFNWLLHILPAALLVIVLGILYPYWVHKRMWSGTIVKLIYVQWFVYILFSGYLLIPVFKKIFSKKHKTTQLEVWVTSIFIGVLLIWSGYMISSFTSYIVGAISFSFVFYLLVLFWIFKRKKNTLFFEDDIKYGNKKIADNTATSIQTQLKVLFEEEKQFKNPDLKLQDVSNQLQTSTHNLSQYLNDNLGKSFSLFINEYRIEEAKKLLISKKEFTIEAIGYECGFNSKSTFFTAFKNITKTTPATYKKKHS